MQLSVETANAQFNEWRTRSRVGSVGVYIHTGFSSVMPQSLRSVLQKVRCSRGV